MKIALVHDWIAGIAGDVRVLNALQEMYPDADVFFLSQGKPSPFLLPFLPSRVESLDLSDYDLVISTGSIFSKGLILRPKTYHINYCHSPTRQVWDLSHSYNHKIFQHFLRIWDRQASTRVDRYIANSAHVQARIKKYYQRDADIIYPPVSKSSDSHSSKAFQSATGARKQVKISAEIYERFAEGLSRDYYLIVSRLYKHKNIDIAIKAFNKLGWHLVIIGEGPEYSRLKALAGPTISMLGYQPDEVVAGHYEHCRAFVMPQDEDFGIAPVEALMHGKPVLALRAGGALEYVQEGTNGLFFDDPHEAILADGVRRLRELNFDPEKIKQSVEKFSWQKFQSSFSGIINQITR